MNRDERRALKKKLAPVAKEVAHWEIIGRDPARRAEAEDHICALMDGLTILEMMAIEDYIMSKGLLKNNFDNSNNTPTEKKEI